MRKRSFPEGGAFLLPPYAAERRAVENKLINMLEKLGYNEISTSAFYYADQFEKVLSRSIFERSYKLTDRMSGRTMLIRPDITLQVAKIISVMPDIKFPYKICYSGKVFRDQTHHGLPIEQKQVGAEFFGSDNPCDLFNFVKSISEQFSIPVRLISLGDGALNSVIATSNNKKTIIKAIRTKDRAKLEKLLDRNQFEIIGKQLNLYDKSQVVEIENIISSYDPEANQIKDIINDLSKRFTDTEIVFDGSDIGTFFYHDGFAFSFYGENGLSIATGGQYRNLMGMFGKPASSVGIAVNLDNLFVAIKNKKKF